MIVVATDQQLNTSRAFFQRIIRPQREVPIILSGVVTPFTRTEPEIVETLRVDVRLDGDNVVFDPAALRNAYGREIAGITDDDSAPLIVPSSPEERLLDHNLRQSNIEQSLINVAIQQLRNSESEGVALVAQLRRMGVSRDRARRILAAIREARRNRAYVPPQSGPLVEIFPGITNAPGSTKVYAVQTFPSHDRAQLSEQEERAIASDLIGDIRTLDPSYVSPTLNDRSIFPTTPEGRAVYLDTLRAELAAARYRVRGDVEPLQMVTLRFLQQRADALYPQVVARYESGELPGLNRGNAIGSKLDEMLRLELRAFYARIGLREDDLVRVNRREYLSRREFRRPDARVADIFFDVSLEDKSVTGNQIRGFRSTEARPTYVIIIRPRQVGRTFLVTPRPSRYRRSTP